jgi:phosphopantetheinyl transferase
VYADWQKPSTIPPLSFEGVQLWRLNVAADVDARSLAAMYRLLSPVEQARADAIRVPAVRTEFMAGRGLLRCLLAAAIGGDPAGVLLETKQNGKPYLAAPSTVEFNVSHSEGLILVALSRAAAVGVDVEFVSEEFGEAEEFIGIAQESFHAGEFSVISRTPPGPERLLAFYGAWTRREAVAKADGRGIASLLKYEVFRADEFGECRVSLSGSRDGSADNGDVDYFVQTPEVGPHHLAALASRKPRQALSLFDAGRLGR